MSLTQKPSWNEGKQLIRALKSDVKSRDNSIAPPRGHSTTTMGKEIYSHAGLDLSIIPSSSLLARPGILFKIGERLKNGFREKKGPLGIEVHSVDG